MKKAAEVKFKEGKNWVSSNFTWLYIGTQDVWCAFLIFLTFSRFGKLLQRPSTSSSALMPWQVPVSILASKKANIG